MSMWEGIQHLNHIIVVGVLAWAAAQLIKTVIALVRSHRLNVRRLWQAGGMPSGHAAFVCSVAFCTGRLYGWGSPVFALAVCLGCVVLYDAMGVRRAAGQHAEALNTLREVLRDAQALPVQQRQKLEALPQLSVSLGHTPLEVLAGAGLGLLLGVLSFVH